MSETLRAGTPANWLPPPPTVIPDYFGSNVGLNNRKTLLRRAGVVALALNGSLDAHAQRVASGLFGEGNPFTSVHLRFEEIRCKRAPWVAADMGSSERVCLRARHPTNATGASTIISPSIRAIVDVIGAVRRAAGVHSRLVYLATDGRSRGRGAAIDALRVDAAVRHGLVVREARDAPRTAIFSEKVRVAVATGSDSGMEINTEIDQLVCAASVLHVGSSISSWDWDVAYLRHGRAVKWSMDTRERARDRDRYLAQAKVEFEYALSLEASHFAPPVRIPPARAGRMYMLDRLFQEGLYPPEPPEHRSRLPSPSFVVAGSGRGDRGALDASHGAACRWRAARQGVDIVTAADLGAFCALWPFVRQPCAEDAAVLTVAAQPWALLKDRPRVRQTGVWPYCGMREPLLDDEGRHPTAALGAVSLRHRNVYACDDDNATGLLRSLGANTSLGTLIAAMGRPRYAPLPRPPPQSVAAPPPDAVARVRAVIFLGDSLMAQYTDVIACTIANHASFTLIDGDAGASAPHLSSRFLLRVMNVSGDDGGDGGGGGVGDGDGETGGGKGRLLIVHATTRERDPLAGRWVSGRLEAVMRLLRLKASDTAIVVNIGLHFIVGANGTAVDGAYAAAMARLVADVKDLAPLQAVWVRTTAVHASTIAASVSAATRHNFEQATLLAVAKLNDVADETLRGHAGRIGAVTPADQVRWSTVDAFGMTATRPDGLFPGDVRHYRSEVIEAIAKQIFLAMLAA